MTLTAGIHEIVAVFNSNKISCVPVVDEAGRPLGIISWRDILKAIEERQRERAAGPRQQAQ